MTGTIDGRCECNGGLEYERALAYDEENIGGHVGQKEERKNGLERMVHIS